MYLISKTQLWKTSWSSIAKNLRSLSEDNIFKLWTKDFPWVVESILGVHEKIWVEKKKQNSLTLSRGKIRKDDIHTQSVIFFRKTFTTEKKKKLQSVDTIVA